jgi:N6-L-threonylcarbamoyladenine synthase
MPRILGIETSCDETAAAVVEDRSRVLSSIVASQNEIHAKYGGVVPELAARRHIEAIGPIVSEALGQARVTLADLDAIAVTTSPGLIGSLLVGVSAAKAMAWYRDLPLVAVNHLEGHIRSPFIEHPEIELPAIALVVSGGHTGLYLCPEEGVYQLLGRTRDDAAGEAFDKIAKLLGLGYPGGPVIDRIAEGADERRFDFPRALMKDHSLDFSFSGQKSEARRQAMALGLARPAATGGTITDEVRDFAASFQRCVVEALVDTTLRACRQEGVRTVLLAGGVACNRRLRRAFDRLAADEGYRVYVPSPTYTTDNAAMIAAAGFLHFEQGHLAPPGLCADARGSGPSWKLS